MSAIRFHFAEGPVLEVRGPERANMEVRGREGAKPISPETLRKYRFRHELSLLDLMARDFDRIEKALGLRE
jgi:hypothetical protein